MKIIKADQAKKTQNSPVCLINEYHLQDKDINGAIATISGRFPSEGFVTNLKCKEIAYVIKGKGEIITKDRKVKLSKGNMVLILPKEKYYWRGTFTLFLSCTPSWSPEQHKQVK